MKSKFPTDNIKLIAVVSPFPSPYGGMAIQAEKLADRLQSEGLVIYRVKTNLNIPSYFQKIPWLRTFVRTCYFLFQLHKTINKVQVVYCLTGFFNFFAWITAPTILLSKAYGVKVVVSARGGEARKFFQKYKRSVRLLFGMVDAITTPSGFLRDVFIEELNMKPVVVPNFADLEQFEFKQRERFQPRLIIARNLEPIYDIQTAIQAFSLVVKTYPEAKLGIVGDGSQRKILEKYVVDLGLKNSVTFYGEVEHFRMPATYNTYDIALNSSKVDNLPGTVLEAFASGLPVVSTKAGGIPYIVEHEVSGLLSNCGDYTDLAKNVIRIVDNPHLGQKFANNGRNETEKYTWMNIRSIILPIMFGQTYYETSKSKA